MSDFDNVVCGSPAQPTKDKNGKQKIIVNEIFGPTIQGEGKTMGKPVKFLRTAGCNLACIWCDTPYTWNWKGTNFQHQDKYEKNEEIHQMSVSEIKAELDKIGQDIKALVISGGEPMLQQNRLVPLLEVLQHEGYWIEIETNGTLVPNDEFIALVSQINCSPKLSNSGTDNPISKRENPEALIKLASLNKTIFKFVVTGEKDMPEIINLVERYNMKNVYLMPEGRTKEEQERKQVMISELCTKYGFSYSPRLHVLMWNSKRKV